MKRLAPFVILTLCCLSASAQPASVTHWWSVGVESSTHFFFATYTPGGSNIFTLGGAYTHAVDRNWRLGGGIGIGGAASTKQVYRTETNIGPEAALDTLATATRNPYVVPLYLRARYVFDPSRTSSWFANFDAGYMLGLVNSQRSAVGGKETTEVFNYYGVFLSPTLGHQFGFSASRTRVSVGAGVNLYFEGREAETAPFDRHRDAHLNFTVYAAFDFGGGKKGS